MFLADVVMAAAPSRLEPDLVPLVVQRHFVGLAVFVWISRLKCFQHRVPFIDRFRRLEIKIVQPVLAHGNDHESQQKRIASVKREGLIRIAVCADQSFRQ
jgi:hypothetical protein